MLTQLRRHPGMSLTGTFGQVASGGPPGTFAIFYLCVGGVFSALPAPGVAPTAASCSGSLLSRLQANAFPAAAIVDVYTTIIVTGATTQRLWRFCSGSHRRSRRPRQHPRRDRLFSS